VIVTATLLALAASTVTHEDVRVGGRRFRVEVRGSRAYVTELYRSNAFRQYALDTATVKLSRTAAEHATGCRVGKHRKVPGGVMTRLDCRK
jgi:hypothetical protein